MKIPFQKIIVIDDDETANLICNYIIKRHLPMVQFIAFTDPETALQHIRETLNQPPLKTIILLDINMPFLDGWEVLERFETFPPAFKEFYSIYMYSSSLYYKDKEQSKSNSLIRDFIDKPITMQKLDNLLEMEAMAAS